MPFKECKQLNLKLYECPSFLFVLMGIITIAGIIATYFIVSKYLGPEIVVIAVTIVTFISLIIGHFVVRSVARIAEAHQMKSEFVSIASHQLRTPLSSLKWTLESMIKTDLNKKQIEYTKMMEKSSQRMLKLVNDLLDVAKIEQNRFEIKKQKFDLKKLIQQIIQELKPIAQASNAEIFFNYQNQNLIVCADKEKIKIVLENLINNAISYSREHNKIIIKAKAYRNAPVQISIQDSGIGILNSQKKQIFKKFFRVQSVLRNQTQGTGLGLIIARAIIKAHKGKIWFKSPVLDKGTIFYFSLPAQLPSIRD